MRTALASGRDRSRRGLADASTVIRREAALARHHWRQSLQLRVVTTTMLLGLAVVSLLGGVLHEQIANSLESDRVAASEYEALALTGQAQTYWDNSTSTSVDELNQAANDIMSRVLAPPGPDPNRYVVMNRSAGNDSDIVLATIQSGALDLSEVSPELQAAVAASPTQQQTQMSEVGVGSRRYPRSSSAASSRSRTPGRTTSTSSTRWSRRWRRWTSSATRSSSPASSSPCSSARSHGSSPGRS